MSEPSDVEIRSATVDDAHQVAAVVSESWRATYGPLLDERVVHGRSLEADERQTKMLVEHGPPGSGVLVAVGRGDVVGVSLFGPPMGEDTPDRTGLLYMLYTVPGAWGTGAGRRLFERTADAMRGAGISSMEAEVLRENERARGFFERRGMRERGSRRQEWFETPVTVVRYSMPL